MVEESVAGQKLLINRLCPNLKAHQQAVDRRIIYWGFRQCYSVKIGKRKYNLDAFFFKGI